MRGYWLADIALGGLNCPIEHLLSSIPWVNPRPAQHIVKAFCDPHHVP